MSGSEVTVMRIQRSKASDVLTRSAVVSNLVVSILHKDAISLDKLLSESRGMEHNNKNGCSSSVHMIVKTEVFLHIHGNLCPH